MGDYNEEEYGYQSVVVTALPTVRSSKKKPAESTTTTTTSSTSTTTTNKTTEQPKPNNIIKPDINSNEVNDKYNINGKKGSTPPPIISTNLINSNNSKDKKQDIKNKNEESNSTNSSPSKVDDNEIENHRVKEEEEEENTTKMVVKNNNLITETIVIDDDDVTELPIKPQLDEDAIRWNPHDEKSNKLLEGFLEKRIKKAFKSITPREHQWKTVSDIIRDLSFPQHQSSFKDGKRYNYLIQHAAGSGKSITIATLVYCLYKLEINNKLKFDTIVIMNDRSQLDAQLGDVIVKFLEANGIKNYCRPKSSKQLQREINNGKNRVVITTMQKFAQLLPNKNNTTEFSFNTNSVAIISDEAHRSHGKSTTERLHEFLVGNIKQTSQLTYFSFTCTPTPQCLEMFGVTSTGRDKIPFYTYSMENALNDKLILDVIDNFTSFKVKDEHGLNSSHLISNGKNNNENQDYSIYDDYDWDGDYYTEDIEEPIAEDKLIQDKCVYILNHFIELKKQYDTPTFKARGMVVCSGRKSLLDYKRTIDSLVSHLPFGEQFDTVAAFSPFVLDGKTIVESDSSVNGKYAHHGTDKGRGVVKALQDDRACKIRLIIVADKLQTGFDEPSLCMMYIDKKISGANVVQTLSRLSRIAHGKKNTAIIDFINNERDIKQLFSIYRHTTSLRSLASDGALVNRLYATAENIKEALSKERNITTFAKSILFHQQSGNAKYFEIDSDIDEFLDTYSRIQEVTDLQLPISRSTIGTIKKTLDDLKNQLIKKDKEKQLNQFTINIRIDYLTDQEAKTSMEYSQFNVDYDADFATSLWAEKKEVISPSMKKEREIKKLNDLSKQLNDQTMKQQQRQFQDRGDVLGLMGMMGMIGNQNNNNNNTKEPSPTKPPPKKSSLFGDEEPYVRKQSVWGMARKDLGKRIVQNTPNPPIVEPNIKKPR